MKVFQNEYINLSYDIEKDLISFTLAVSVPITSGRVFAAAPPQIDYSYAGSLLPYPTAKEALENTPNSLSLSAGIPVVSGKFKMPNSFYEVNGATKVPPTIFVSLLRVGHTDPTIIRCTLKEPYPVKSLTYRQLTRNPTFYNIRAELVGVRSQWEIFQMVNTTQFEY